MIYHCDNCRFTFTRETRGITVCPDCGKEEVRPATEEESQVFEAYLRNSDNED